MEGTTSSSGKGPKVEKEENIALARKGKAKKGPNQGQDFKGEKKKKDLSKVKCSGCSALGHYVIQCPKRKKDKKGKQTTSSTNIYDLSTKLEDEFTLFAAISSNGGGF